MQWSAIGPLAVVHINEFHVFSMAAIRRKAEVRILELCIAAIDKLGRQVRTPINFQVVLSWVS